MLILFGNYMKKFTENIITFGNKNPDSIPLLFRNYRRPFTLFILNHHMLKEVHNQHGLIWNSLWNNKTNS